MTEEQKKEEYEKFNKIIYDNLVMILERRPTFPVKNFAKA